MSDIYKKFEAYLEPGDRVLDLGCGSGRDSKYFLDQGYAVVALDPSIRMCEATAQLTSLKPLNITAQEMDFKDEFQGIWACASLLHISEVELDEVLIRIVRSLKTNGIMYASWKLGNGYRYCDGKEYYDMNEEALLLTMKRHATLNIIECWRSDDLKEKMDPERWLNIIIKKF